MKILTTRVEVTDIGFALNGTITCVVTVYYRSASGKRKEARHVFNISELIKEWSK